MPATQLNGVPTTTPPAAPVLGAPRRLRRGQTALPAPGTTRPAKGRKARPAPGGARRSVAVAAFAVAVALLTLSITHLTESISVLTGTYWLLAALLAVGVDAGMLAAEAAVLTSSDTGTQRWALSYVVAATVASMGLNAYAFATHAPAGCAWAAIALGILIPGLVLVLGKVGGQLWLGK